MKIKQNKLFRRLLRLKKINLVKCFIINSRIHKKNNRKFPFLIYGNAKARVHKSAKICIDTGSFEFNYPYRSNEPFPSLFEMLQNSQLIIEGRFQICSGAHVIISDNATLRLGSGYINRHARIKCFCNISIGHYVAISENCTIWDSDAHDIVREGFKKSAPIVIGDHVWIGTNVIILKGVTVGNNSIVAAGSVLNKSVPPNCLVAGNPAKVIKTDIAWK